MSLLSSLPAAAKDPYTTLVPGTRPEDEVEVPGVVYSDGIPTRLRQIHSKANIDELFAFFYQHFREVGLYIPPEGNQPHMVKGYILTAVDTETFATYTVILQPVQDGTTTVVMGSALPTMKEPPKVDGDTIPLYPGAKESVRTRSEGSSMVTYEADAKPEQVTAYYADILGRGGYVALKEPGAYRGHGREVLLYTKEFGPKRTGVTVTVRNSISEDEERKPPPKH